MTSPRPELSIIIPSYNEERRLPKALKEIQEYLSRGHCAPK